MCGVNKVVSHIDTSPHISMKVHVVAFIQISMNLLKNETDLLKYLELAVMWNSFN